VAYGNVNLGNVAQALRLSGYESSWLDDEQRRRLLESTPQAPAVLPDTNRALAALGANYRVPEPEHRELPPNPSEEPAPPPVSERSFNPNVGTPQLMREQTAGQNEALDLKQRQGDIASESFDRQAQAAGEFEQRSREGLNRAQQRVDENRQQQRVYEQQAHQRFQRISELVDNPPDESRGKVLRIIGAILGATDQGAAVGRGLSMLGQSMAGDVQGWARQIEAQKVAQGSALEMAQHQQADSEHELRTEKALTDMGFGVYGAALERIKAETNSQEAKRVADELQNGLRQKYVEHQLDLNARSAAASAKNQQGRADDALWNMPLDALAEAISNGTGGKRAQEIYMQRSKNSQGVREGEAKIADLTASTEKKQREAIEGNTNEEVLPGYVTTVGLGPADKTAIRANAMGIDDIVADIGRLRQIRERNQGGTWNADDEAEAEGIRGRMSTKLSQLNGAGAPSEGERELFAKQIVDPTGFYMRKNPTEIYDRMAKDLRAGFEAKLKSIGLVRGGANRGALGYQRDQSAGGEPVASRGASGGW
jgi:hypothetical protein